MYIFKLITFKSPLPVKLIVKKMGPSAWIVACMVPRGNMMHCMLKEIEGTNNLVQTKFIITLKEVPEDIMEVEMEMNNFLESGITNINREGMIACVMYELLSCVSLGDSLIVRAGDRDIAFTADKS